MALIPGTDLDVFPLCLGGNVFGWTADEATSFAVLDAYADAGGNFIDTADVYSAWVPGNRGGESEAIIGRWLARTKRKDVLVATKVGMAPGLTGLRPTTIRSAVEASLKRLGVERIDLYYAHRDDPETPLADTLGAFDALVREGKLRAIAASNYSAARLTEALALSEKLGLARYVALQPEYNLVARAEFEQQLLPVLSREGLVAFPYYGLARGFLSGKYRPGVEVDSPRSALAKKHLEGSGLALLGELDRIAEQLHTSVAAVALAWLRAQPGVLAPIASARTVEQLRELLASTRIELSREAQGKLDALTLPS
jgi:aryl-alcohol dehydrogenase-like predicted oxidoreductase